MRNECDAGETSLESLEECTMSKNDTSDDKNCRLVKDKCKEYQHKDGVFISLMNYLNLMVEYAKLHKGFYEMFSTLLAEECGTEHVKLGKKLSAEYEIRCDNAALFAETCVRYRQVYDMIDDDIKQLNQDKIVGILSVLSSQSNIKRKWKCKS